MKHFLLILSFTFFSLHATDSNLTKTTNIYITVDCPDCNATGVKTYPTAALWHKGGMAAQVITEGVCNRCWGTGDLSRKGKPLK